MAKRSRKSSRRERVPVIDFLIDMAGVAALNYFSYRRREKSGRKRSHKIDPYEATGIAMSMGRLNDTEDLIQLGGILGAMGAFDSDVSEKSYPHHAKPRSNRYAWRLNCEDGSAYGISPENYETREEYHRALKQKRDLCANNGLQAEKTADSNTRDGTTAVQQKEDAPSSDAQSVPACEDLFEDDDLHVFIYCEVATKSGVDYYRTEDRSIQKGDKVIVRESTGNTTGTVLSVEHHMRFSVPKAVAETKTILHRVKTP